MASIKRFGLSGVGSTVQYGKAGGNIKFDSGAFAFRNSADDAFVNVSVLTPTEGTHAATKTYVDSVATGLDVKNSVRVATTENIDLTTGGLLTIDGVTLAANDRVLVKDQSTASQNGIYVVVDGTWTRATDADNSPETGEVTGGMFTFVEEGTQYQDTGWILSSPNGSVTLDTDPLVFTQFSSAGVIQAGAGMTKDGNTLNVVGTADRITVNADDIDIASTYVGQTSITTLGTVTTGTWNAEVIDETYGGLGANVAAFGVGSLFIANNGGGATELAKGSNNTVLKVDGSGTLGYAAVDLTADVGSSVLPVANGGLGVDLSSATGALRVDGGTISAGDIDLTADVTGILPSANGGTGADTSGFGDNSIVYYSSGVQTELAIGSAGEFLRVASGGGLEYTTAAITDLSDVAFSTLAADDLLQWDGANWVNVDPSTIGGNSYSTITGDTGSATAASTSDSIAFVGATNGGIVTVAAEGTDSVTFAVDINDLTARTVALTGSDLIAYADADDSNTVKKATITELLQDLDIVTAAADGILVRTAADTYASRTLTASTAAGEEGIVITNAAGGTGDPTFGLDITNLTLSTEVAGTMELPVYDGTNNVKITLSELLADLDDNKISQGDTSVVITDTGTGQIVWTVDGNAAATLVDATGWSFSNDVTVATGNSFTVTDGTATFGGQIDAAGGTAAAPAYSFTGDLDSGMYSDTANTVCIAGAGVDVACFEGDSGVTGGEHIVFTHAAGEVRIEGTNTAGSGAVDIRLVPQGTGQVFLGEPGVEASITTSDGTSGNAGEDLRITAGDGDTNTGGNINIGPGAGTTDGTVCIQSAPSSVGGDDTTRTDIACFVGVASAVNSLKITNAATTDAPLIEAVGETNVDIAFLPAGTGKLTIDTAVSAADYAAGLGDNDIPNVKYVSDAIANAVSGGIFAVEGTVDFTSASAQTIGTLPANARVIDVRLEVNTASDVATTVDVGDGSTADVYMADTLNDPEVVGAYDVDVRNVTPTGSDITVTATVGTAGGQGAGRVILRYIAA